ncbi:MAG TPA: AI-2E family transporter [Vicinamibacterales bacterium]|nr:AI-2E family transporter [Vicinamibacterales bacterium]
MIRQNAATAADKPPARLGEDREDRADETVDIPDSWWRQHLHVAVWLLVAGLLVFFLKYAAEALVPFVLSGLLFYALDPAVDALERWRVPRALGAALMLGMALSGAGTLVYSLQDDVEKVIRELPDGARRLRASLRRDGDSSTLDAIREATKEIDKTAAEATGASSPPSGVVRVQVEEPVFKASDYLLSGSTGLVSLSLQLVMVSFLAYFLLVANDLFKRKLVKHTSSTLAGKKITVNMLEAIGTQIERFVLVQVLTSFLVAVVTGTALWWLGLENAAVWGLAAGIFNSIPYFGPLIVTCGLAVVAFLQFMTLSMAAVIAGVALVITSLEGWLLTPMLMGRASQMNPVALFAGLLIWSWMWGFWGTLLAVPMMMVLKAICDHVEDFAPVADFLSD